MTADDGGLYLWNAASSSMELGLKHEAAHPLSLAYFPDDRRCCRARLTFSVSRQPICIKNAVTNQSFGEQVIDIA
jgi:hypothetical protein